MAQAGGTSTWTSIGSSGLTPIGIVIFTITIETCGLARSRSAFSTPALLISSSELLAIERRRRVAPGVIQAGDQAHALDPHLAAADHEAEVADGLLDLRRRRSSSSSWRWWAAAPTWVSVNAITAIAARAPRAQRRPGTMRRMNLPPCAAVGENPRTRPENRAASFARSSPAHFPVRRTAEESRSPRGVRRVTGPPGRVKVEFSTLSLSSLSLSASPRQLFVIPAARCRSIIERDAGRGRFGRIGDRRPPEGPTPASLPRWGVPSAFLPNDQ